MKIERIPTKTERWFLAMYAKEADLCARAGNAIGIKFWVEILRLSHEDFYYRR